MHYVSALTKWALTELYTLNKQETPPVRAQFSGKYTRISPAKRAALVARVYSMEILYQVMMEFLPLPLLANVGPETIFHGTYCEPNLLNKYLPPPHSRIHSRWRWGLFSAETL